MGIQTARAPQNIPLKYNPIDPKEIKTIVICKNIFGMWKTDF